MKKYLCLAVIFGCTTSIEGPTKVDLASGRDVNTALHWKFDGTRWVATGRNFLVFDLGLPEGECLESVRISGSGAFHLEINKTTPAGTSNVATADGYALEGLAYIVEAGVLFLSIQAGAPGDTVTGLEFTTCQ